MAVLNSFSVNWTNNQVALTFDVAVSAIDTTKLYAVRTSTDTSVALPIYGTASGLGTTTVTIALDAQSVFNIQQTFTGASPVWDNQTNAYIYVASASAITPSFDTVPFRLQAATVTPNSSPAFVLNFPIALANTEAPTNSAPYNLQLVVNNNVNTTSNFNFNRITLQNAASSPTGTMTLTGGSAFTGPSGNLYIKFNDADFNTYKNTFLPTTIGPFYLTTTAGAFRDVFGNSALATSALINNQRISSYTVGYKVGLGSEFITGGTNGQVITATGTDQYSGLVSWTTPGTLGTSTNSNLVNTSNSIPISIPSTTYALALPTTASAGLVGYGGGKFVSLSTETTDAAYSTDGGQTWTATTLPIAAQWRSIAYGNGVFVAVGVNVDGTTATNIALSSSDGITWTQRTLPGINTWTSVTFANNIFVAVGYGSGVSSEIARSTNGTSWTAVASPYGTATGWQSITYGNNIFVAISTGGSNRAAYSTDATDWLTQTLPDTGNSTRKSIAFGNGVFVINSLFRNIEISTDGLTWTSYETFPYDFGSNITSPLSFGALTFLVNAWDPSTGTSYIVSSFDGINWSTGFSFGPSGGVINIAYGTDTFTINNFIACPYNSRTVYSFGTPSSAAGTSFSNLVNLGPVSNLQISGGTTGQVLTSNGGSNLSWTSPTLPNSYTSVATIAIGDVFVGTAGPDGTVAAPTTPSFGQTYLADSSKTYNLDALRFIPKQWESTTYNLGGSLGSPGIPYPTASLYAGAQGTLQPLWVIATSPPSGYRPTILTASNPLGPYTQAPVNGTNLSTGSAGVNYASMAVMQTGTNTRTWVVGCQGAASRFLISTDEGASWAASTGSTPASTGCNALATAKITATTDRIIACLTGSTSATQIQTSTDGDTWTVVTPSGTALTNTVTSIAVNPTGAPGSQVCVGVFGTTAVAVILLSTDSGATWQYYNGLPTGLTASTWTGVHWNANLQRFVLLSSTSLTAYSTDGVSWIINVSGGSTVAPSTSLSFVFQACKFITDIELGLIGTDSNNTYSGYQGLTQYSLDGETVKFRWITSQPILSSSSVPPVPSAPGSFASYSPDFVMLPQKQANNIAIRTNSIWIDSMEGYMKAPSGSYKCLGPASVTASSNSYLWLRTA